MILQGYVSVEVKPWENASGGKAVECAGDAVARGCAASFAFMGEEGKYTLDIVYFDQKNGASKFSVYVGDRKIDHWVADDQLPATKIGADAAKRRRIQNVTLTPGETIRIEGVPDRDEHAGLDYVEITPVP